VNNHVPSLQLLADYKYDHYQRFGPGQRFVESLALWLKHSIRATELRLLALFVNGWCTSPRRSCSILVQTAYPDVIAQERLQLVAGSRVFPPSRVGKISQHSRFKSSS